MSGIISNPKYKGYYVGNKVKVVDMFTKKQKFLPPDEWVMFKDETGEIVPAIVSEELWDSANGVLKRRSEDVKARQGICNHDNLLTGKLICTQCGKSYYRRESKDKKGNVNSKWVCSGKINNGADSCDSFPIYEEEIKPVLYDVFRETETYAEALIEQYIQLYRSLEDKDDIGKQIAECEKRIDMATRKKAKLLEYNVTGQLSDHDFLTMNKQCTEEIETAQAALKSLEEQQFSKEEFRRHMEEVRHVLRQAQQDAETGIITKEFVDKYINKVFVTPESEHTARLEVKIFTGETCERFLKKMKARSPQEGDIFDVRTGHTSKKMIESYENNLSAK